MFRWPWSRKPAAKPAALACAAVAAIEQKAVHMRQFACPHRRILFRGAMQLGSAVCDDCGKGFDVGAAFECFYDRADENERRIAALELAASKRARRRYRRKR